MQPASAVARIVRRTASWDTLGFAVSLALVAAACFVLYRLLGDVDVGKIAAALRAIPPRAVITAFLLIAASYFTLTFYDYFALRVIGHTHIPYRIAALTGFMAYTIGHNIGATVLTGGLVRFRIYRGWGLGLVDIAKIAFMTGLTFWLGNAVALGIGLIYAPEVASAINQLPAWMNRALAVAALAVIAIYLLWLVPRPRVIGRNGWKVTLPNSSLTLIQIGIGLADLGLSALAMYVLIAAYAPVDLSSAAVAYVTRRAPRVREPCAGQSRRIRCRDAARLAGGRKGAAARRAVDLPLSLFPDPVRRRAHRLRHPGAVDAGDTRADQ